VVVNENDGWWCAACRREHRSAKRGEHTSSTGRLVEIVFLVRVLSCCKASVPMLLPSKLLNLSKRTMVLFRLATSRAFFSSFFLAFFSGFFSSSSLSESLESSLSGGAFPLEWLGSDSVFVRAVGGSFSLGSAFSLGLDSGSAFGAAVGVSFSFDSALGAAAVGAVSDIVVIRRSRRR
jgi:hypothetical protein